MRVLLVGNGGREHAIAYAISKTQRPRTQIYAYMGAKNPGIIRRVEEHKGEYVVGDVRDGKAIAKWAAERRMDLVVIGSDPVLEAGVVDELERVGIRCASPVRAAARLEWDKAWARELMRKHGVPGVPAFGVFKEPEDAARFIDSLGRPVAIKPAGLTGGKGVRVVGAQLRDNDEAKAYAREVIDKAIGGIMAVVVEERLEGEEFTLQAFCDGKTLVPMPLVQDHKRAFEGDEGPNTGGMGSYSDADHLLPFVEPSDYEKALEIMRKTVAAFSKETGLSYKGVLYGQFMLTRNGPMLLEYNARFGDPEAMNVLTLLESDFVELLERTIDGTLPASASFERSATVCKYIVPKGYPDNPAKNEPVIIDEFSIRNAGAHLFYAAVNMEEEKVLYTTSSRTAGVVGVSTTIEEAEKLAEYACQFVTGEVFHRRDIGTRALVDKRVEHMRKIRGR